MKSPNILFVSEQVIPSNKAPLTASLQSFIDRYKQFGSLTCACYHADEGREIQEVPKIDGVKFLLLKKENTLANKFPNSRYNYKSLKQAIGSYDLVIVHLPSPIGNKAVNLANRTGIPAVAGVVGCGFEALWYYGWKGKLMAIPSFCSMRRTVKKSTNAFYVSQTYLQRRYPNCGKTMGASDVEIKALDERVLSDRLLKVRSLDLTEKGVVRLCVIGGVHLRYKGFQWVVEAVGKLNSMRGPKFHLHIVGGGDKSRLESLAKKLGVMDFVHFEGQHSHGDVMAILDQSDIYMHPSLTEGVPRSLIEACSRALPSFGSAIPGVKEILPDADVFPCKSVDGIVEFLSHLTHENMEKRARQNFQKAGEFVSDILVKRRNDFFKEIISALPSQNSKNLHHR